MARAKLIDDYGGNSYGGRRRTRQGGKHVSMRCCDCKKLRYVLPRELARAAAPRCLYCGGPLEQIDASRKREGLPSQKRLAKELSRERAPTRRCSSCGIAIESNEQMYRHALSRPDCVRYYAVEKRLHNISGSSLAVLSPTVHIVRDCKKWLVVAVAQTGHVVELFRARHQYLCRDWINDEFGPVELAR